MVETTTTLDAQAIAPPGELLDETTVHETLVQGLAGKFTGARVLVLIPDHTRTLPLPMLFRHLVEILADTRSLDFMVALGTHPPLDDEALYRLVGINAEQHLMEYAHIGLMNHAWDDPRALAQIGIITQAQVQEIAWDYWHPSLGGDVPVRINRLALEYDQILILGPTFPHEVVGFSGGAKYLFPGISGAEMINVTHWLGALMTVLNTIGVEQTPVRDMIHLAASMVKTPVKLIALTVVHDGLAGMSIGSTDHAFHAAAELSSERHITWVDQPYRQVLSVAPKMYDELWVGAKAMYKLEPAIADGGEVIIYAPHLDTVSHVHGKYIYKVGYHVRDYFLGQWDRFKDYPLGVLAHSTHLRGAGRFEDGVEYPRIQVTLASKIPKEDCERLNLGYLNPAEIDLQAWKNREDEGLLYVPKAGEMLYRVRR
ncbi:MAG: lactate racemase domain-containing protein [bacterium]|nr:lactate racemase domain-containing protein [bacterium]